MPLVSNSNSIIDLENITDILRETPEIPQEYLEMETFSQIRKRKSDSQELSDIKEILNRNNGSVEDASSVITEVMHQSKFDNTRIKAAEIVLDLHEIRNKEGKLNKQPIINFNIISSEVQIANVFAPHVSRNSQIIGDEEF